MKDIKTKQEIVKRLKIIEGHLRKVRQMAAEDRYCVDVLQQSLAVQKALAKVDELILGNHLRSCVSQAVGDKKREKIEEIINLFKKRR